MKIDIVCVGKLKEKYLVQAIDGDKILAQIKDTAYVITLDLGGKMVTSEAFAQMISNCGIQGNSHLVFVIGGSLGLADKVLKRANGSLSFSKMTFPHQLFRVMLLEQIYRGYRIINGEPYHK